MGSACSAPAPADKNRNNNEEKARLQEQVRPAAPGATQGHTHIAVTAEAPVTSMKSQDENPSLSAGDQVVHPLPQFESPPLNPLVVMVPTSLAPQTQPVSRPSSSSNVSSRNDSSTTPLSEDMPRHLRRFLSDSDIRSGSLGASDRTNIYIPGDVPDLNMLPVASAVADFTDSEVTSVSGQSMESLLTPKSPPDSIGGFTSIVTPS